MIIGEETISYLNGAGSSRSIDMNPATISAYGKIDENGSRWILGDHTGRLSMLLLKKDEAKNKVTGLSLEKLGETNIPSAVAYLDNGYIFIGSCFGDSQLVKINPEASENEPALEVVDEYLNLGPIVDFCVVDLERQGQGQVVTCSGAYKNGTLRIVRNGIGINKAASIQVPGIKQMWSLRPSFRSSNDEYIVLSFIGETRLMGMVENELEETVIAGFASDASTIACSNVIDDCWVQVCA